MKIMINNIKKLIFGLGVGCGIAVGFTACSDTWDDHYESTSTIAGEGTIWEAISSNPELSNFASVLKACDFDQALNSSQVFTVFAPTNANFSKADADALIQEYNEQKGKVSDDENTVIKEFVRNHVALYNYSVSKAHNDTITLMNGKYAVLQTDRIDKTPFEKANQLYSNGVLFITEKPVAYFPNVFEYFRKDADFDSVRSFLYSEWFYRSVFQPRLSVAGGIENGKTVYLDSVFRQTNVLFDVLEDINSEDSTYWMVAPTNEQWKALVDEYSQYFVYEDNVGRYLTEGTVDSLIYTAPRLAILRGTVFNRTFNSDAAIPDSVMSTNSVYRYNWRSMLWGADTLCYYQYFRPNDEGGVFSGATATECSNGQVMKVPTWNFAKEQTFFQTRIIEAEGGASIREVSKEETNATTKDSTVTISAVIRNVNSDNPFYNKVSNNRFVEFAPNLTTRNHYVLFNISNVLSNIGYDIYLVTAPALAADTTATVEQRLPTILTCTLNYRDKKGDSKTMTLGGQFTTSPDEVQYVKLAENFKFPVCTTGISEGSNTSVSLKVETNVTSRQQRNKTHTRTMRIDCIVLKPHVE